MTAPAARWKTEPAPVEAAPIYDPRVERPTGDVLAPLYALADELRRMEAKWSACWCGVEQERDCPRHGSGDCRHMAEGIVCDLRAVLARLGTAEGESR